MARLEPQNSIDDVTARFSDVRVSEVQVVQSSAIADRYGQAGHQEVNPTGETPRAIAEAMVAMLDPAHVIFTEDNDRFAVAVGNATIVFGEGDLQAYERLASAIEARIAWARATSMVVAAGQTGVPLWLVTGSDVLGKWLAWSRTDKALARVLSLTDRGAGSPVTGYFARRTRKSAGQMAVKIRVFGGQAVAEQVDLSHRVPAFAKLGDRATIRVARHQLPQTLLVALAKDPTSNDRRRASEIVGHPFFVAHDFMVAQVRNDGSDVVVELETSWQPLAPIPKDAWDAVPRGAHPVFPWRATNCEVAELYALAGRGQQLLQGESCTHDIIARHDPR
jgi:hypothetical protein